MNLVRVYTKPKGKLPDYTQPVVLRAGRCTVEDFVSKLQQKGRGNTNHFSVMRFTRALWRISVSPLSMASQ